MRGSPVQKNRQIFTRNSLDFADFLQKIALTLESGRVNYPYTLRYLNEKYIFD